MLHFFFCSKCGWLKKLNLSKNGSNELNRLLCYERFLEAQAEQQEEDEDGGGSNDKKDVIFLPLSENDNENEEESEENSAGVTDEDVNANSKQDAAAEASQDNAASVVLGAARVASTSLDNLSQRKSLVTLVRVRQTAYKLRFALCMSVERSICGSNCMYGILIESHFQFNLNWINSIGFL